jgi:phosphate transport system protein
MVGELRSNYHRELEEINLRLTQMIASVEDAISAAGAALLSSDDEAAQHVVLRGQTIEELRQSVEALVFSELARQAPVGGELRYLVAALRLVPELELTRNLAGDLARRGNMRLGAELPPRVRGLVANMFDQSLSMWRQVANAFAERLPEAARLLESEDDNLEEVYVVLTSELASGLLRPPVLLEMALVARFLKRLGDHAVESARWIASFSGPGERGAS